MASLSYDLIVLGDDFAGLVAATLCASRGMRVLLAQPRKAPAAYRLAKETFPSGSLVLCGLERPGAQRVLAELNFEHTMRRKLTDRAIPFQILGPRLRLELDPRTGRLPRALLRETGGSDEWLRATHSLQEPLDALLRDGANLPSTGFWEKRELGKRLPAAHELATSWLEDAGSDSELFVSRMCQLASSGSDSAAPLETARSVASAMQGIPRLEGGRDAWRTLFLDKLQSHSGETRLIDPQQIETSWSKVTGVVAVDDDVRCDHLIAAMPASALLPLLDAKAQKRLLQQGSFPGVYGYRYTLNLLVHMSGLPEGLSELSASMRIPDGDPRGGNFAVISHRPAHSTGKTIVTLEGIAPADDEGNPALAAMRDALLAHAEERMPFLSQHIELVDSPHEESEHKRDLGSPLLPRPIWNPEEDESLHMSVRSYSTGTKQMWLASEQNLPGLGLEGQFIAAYGAAKLASSGKGKSAPKPSVLSASGG